MIHHRKEYRVDNVFLSSFNHALPKLKVRPVSANFSVVADCLRCAAPQTLSYSFGRSISNLSHDPRTLPPQAAHLQQQLLSGGPKAGICTVSRKDVDLPMRNFINILWVFLKIKPLQLREACSRSRSWNGRLQQVVKLPWWVFITRLVIWILSTCRIVGWRRSWGTCFLHLSPWLS